MHPVRAYTFTCAGLAKKAGIMTKKNTRTANEQIRESDRELTEGELARAVGGAGSSRFDPYKSFKFVVRV